MPMLTAGSLPTSMRTIDNPTWTGQLVDRLGSSITTQLKQGIVPGMPASWPYPPITLNDINEDGSLGSWLVGRLVTYAQGPAADDPDLISWYGSGPRPAPQPDDIMQTPAEAAAARAATALGLDIRQQQFAEAKFAIEMAASQAPRVSSSGSRSSSGGSGGGGGGGTSAVDYASKLGYAQSAGQLELEFAKQKMAMELDFLKQKYALQSDPNSIENQHWQAQFDEQKRQHDSTLAYQSQRDQRQEQLARAETTAKLGANPGDAVQRELFLRTGKEPVGTPQSVWTGQPTGGAPTTLSQLMTSLTAGGVFGQPPALPAGTPTTVPYNTDPMNQPPPPPSAPPPPTFAFGTQRPRSEITPDGWTRAREFISGDPQVPAHPNPERVQLRVVNGEPQAKVTPLSGPPPPRMMGQRHRMPDGSMMAGPPMFAYGTVDWNPTRGSYVGTSSATQSDIDQARAYYASQAYTGPTPAYDQFAGMAPTDLITNKNSYQYGMTVEAAKAQNLAPKNTNAVSYDPQGKPHPIYDTSLMTQAEQNAYNIGALTPDRNTSGATQSLYPSMANYKPPADLPPPPAAAPPPPAPKPAAAPVQPPPTAVAPAQPPPATPAPAQPAAPAAATTPQQAYWGTTPLTPGLQTITNSPFVSYASIGNPANVQIMDAASGQYRALRPGEDIPAGATVGVLNPTGTTGTGATPSGATGAPGVASAPPPPKSTVSANGSTTVFKGVSLPAPSFDTADSYGNARVTKPGYVTTPDGGGYYYLMGDGSEVKRPDGSYVYYNPVTKGYVPVTASPTIISSMAQFYALPRDVQQKILSGQPTGYMLNDKGIDTHIASQMIEQERSRIAKERGISPAQVPAQLLEMFANQFFAGLEPGRIYPAGWVSSMMAPQGGPGNRMLTPEEFRALPVDQQRSLLDGTSLSPATDPLAQYRGSTGIYNPGSQNYSASTGPMGGMPTGLFTLPAGTPDGQTFDYQRYLTSDDDYRRLYPEKFNQRPPSITPAPITPAPVTPTPIPVNNTPPPVSTPPPPPLTPPPSAGGTGAALPDVIGQSQASPTNPATVTPPAPTGNTALDQLLAVLSYGGEVYQSIPALQYIMGQLSEGQFNTVTTQDTVVPQLGITLPAPGKLNYQMLNNVKQNSPGSFELLKSLFAAGNRDLDNEMAITRQAAPLGSAYEPSLVQT